MKEAPFALFSTLVMPAVTLPTRARRPQVKLRLPDSSSAMFFATGTVMSWIWASRWE
jgi:hypothetical protein